MNDDQHPGLDVDDPWDDILACAGGGAAGGHSAFFPSWSRGRSVPFVSREVPT